MRMPSELWFLVMSAWDGGHKYTIDDRVIILSTEGLRGGQHITSFFLTNPTSMTMNPRMQATSAFHPFDYLLSTCGMGICLNCFAGRSTASLRFPPCVLGILYVCNL